MVLAPVCPKIRHNHPPPTRCGWHENRPRAYASTLLRPFNQYHLRSRDFPIQRTRSVAQAESSATVTSLGVALSVSPRYSRFYPICDDNGKVLPTYSFLFTGFPT